MRYIVVCKVWLLITTDLCIWHLKQGLPLKLNHICQFYGAIGLQYMQLYFSTSYKLDHQERLTVWIVAQLKIPSKHRAWGSTTTFVKQVLHCLFTVEMFRCVVCQSILLKYQAKFPIKSINLFCSEKSTWWQFYKGRSCLPVHHIRTVYFSQISFLHG